MARMAAAAVHVAAVHTVAVRKDQERQLYYPVVKLLAHGVETETEYHHAFFVLQYKRIHNFHVGFFSSKFYQISQVLQTFGNHNQRS